MTKVRGKRRAALERAVRKLDVFIPRAAQVIRQTRARIIRGVPNSEGKILSISAGNYGGKLGPFHYHLRKLLA